MCLANDRDVSLTSLSAIRHLENFTVKNVGACELYGISKVRKELGRCLEDLNNGLKHLKWQSGVRWAPQSFCGSD